MAWSFDSYLPVVTARESGGDDNAQNPTSSASGRYQFIDSTYLPLARAAFPGRSDEALMAIKNRPEVQNTVMKSFTEQNVSQLQRAGIDVNNGSVYASHFLGGPGAIRALSAPDNTPIAQVVNPDSIAANRGVFKNISTVGDFKRWAGSYGASKADLPASDAVPTSGTLNSSTAFSVPGNGPVRIGPLASLQGGTGVAPAPVDDSLGGQIKRAFGREDGEPWSASEALTGAGIALMARDNPSGAAALAASLKNDKRKTQKSSPWELKNFDPATGRAIRVNTETGEFQPYQVAEPYRELSVKERTEFDDRHEKLGIYDETINDANKYRNMIANGQIDLSATAQFAAGARKLTDQSTQADRNAAEYAQFITRLQNAGQRLNKGVQTEGDAVRTLNEIAPKMSSYDNAATLTNLDNVIKTSRNRVDSLVKNQNSVYDYYGEQAPRGTYKDDYRNALNRYSKYDDDYTPVRDNFLKTRDAAKADPSSTPSPRVAPARDESGSAPSFGDFMRRRLGR